MEKEVKHQTPAVKSFLQSILVEKLGVEESEIKENSDLRGDLGADSLDLVEIIMEVEKGYQMEIPDTASTTVNTVADMLKVTEDCIEATHYKKS